MARQRETSVRESALERADLWADVEEDVEKKRHVKNPFRESYVALVAAPFDAFLTKTSGRNASSTSDDVDMYGEIAYDDMEDHVALQHGLLEFEKSRQDPGKCTCDLPLPLAFHTEILRRQMQCLVEESSAVLDPGALVPKSEARKKKKAEDAEATSSERSEESIINLERALERATLYESGELTDLDLQKSWNRNHCACVKHGVVGVEAKLKSMEANLNDHYQAFREQYMLQLGPRLPNDVDVVTTDSEMHEDEIAQFLEDCKRSIKPFFLEDFAQLDHTESQQDQDSQLNDTSISRMEEPSQHLVQPALSAALPDDNVTMDSDVVSNGNSPQTARVVYEQPSFICEDDDVDAAARVPSSFCVASLRAKRSSLHKTAMRIRAQHAHTRRLPVRVSRQYLDPQASSTRPAIKLKFPPLLVESKKWRNLSMSIINPAVDLIELRKALVHEHNVDESVSPNGHSVCSPSDVQRTVPPSSQPDPGERSLTAENQLQVHVPPTQYEPTKRQLDAVGAPPTKRLCVNEVAHSRRPTTLRTMMASIRDFCHRVAQSSCVSYLSTLLRSELVSCNPQRAFVSLVFSASLANTSQISKEPSSNKSLRVTLRSATEGRDVKIVCTGVQ